MPEQSEEKRLGALMALEILNTSPEADFDDLARLAALTFKTPIALISLVDEKEQWFKAKVGWELSSTPRDIAFCDHTIRSDDVLVVPDALEDERFRDNPLVKAEPCIRFYAGAPLTTPDGHRVGTLCVLDYSPRHPFSPAKRARMKDLASNIMHVMRHRAAARRSQHLAHVAADRAQMLALAEEAATVGTWVFDVPTGELTWSQETYRIFGFDPNQPPPAMETLLACYRPLDAARLQRHIDQSVQLGQGYENQAEIRRPDGEVRYVFSRAMHRVDGSGKVVALYGAVQDVTAIKQADVALREREARLRKLNWALTAHARSSSALLRGSDSRGVAENVCEAIVADKSYALACVALADSTPDKSINIVACSGRATAYMQDLKLSWSEELPEGSGPTGRAIRSGEAQIVADSLQDPHFIHWRDRAQAHGIRSSVTVPFSNDGSVRGALLVYATRPAAFGPEEMEVFQRLAAELAFAMILEDERARLALAEAAERETLECLKASEARFRLLAENVPDIIMMYNIDGEIEYVSPAVRRLGFEPERVIGRSLRNFSTAAEIPSLNALREGRPLPAGRENETLGRTVDGRSVWLQGNPAAIYDDAGKPVGIVTAIRDVTERRRLDEELLRKQAEAETAAQVKSQFLANMSHEIRTPLTSVIGFARLLGELDDLPPLAKHYADRIITGGDILLALVNDVLDFSRLEAGKIELDLRACSVPALLDETVGLVAQAAAAKGLALKVERLTPLPEALAIDRGRLRQVLLNLLGNAVKFTATGGVTLVVRHDDHDDGSLSFEVVDTGVGIAANDAQTLFQRFSQIDGSNTREFGGAGLGLAISKGLVEAMGGEIGMRSAPGQGSTFWFTVRASLVDPEVRQLTNASEEPVLAPLRVLLTDDVAVNRELISTMLAPFDVVLTEAKNGAEAVQAAAQLPFDVILMDLQMPVMDGLAATREIRANLGPNRNTPILAITANVLEAQLETCRDAGMNDHIGKPIDPRDLLVKIASVLS